MPGRWWLMLALVSGLLVGIGCGGSTATPTATPQLTTVTAPTAPANTPVSAVPTPPPATAPPPTAAVPVPSPTQSASGQQAVPIDEWRAAWQGVRSFVARVTAHDSNGNLLMEMEFAVERPDRLHAKSLSARDGQPSMEMIVIGDRFWMNVGGLWIEVPSANQADMVNQAFRFEERILAVGPLPAYSYVGEETVDGIRTSVWRAQWAEYNATTTLWFGADNLPRRMVWEDANGRLDYRYSRYNEPLNIRAPTQ